jgi:hypothetical protein
LTSLGLNLNSPEFVIFIIFACFSLFPTGKLLISLFR